ncbi:MAG: hypothetical protein ACXU8U_02625 [Asticcacaulis sp.]
MKSPSILSEGLASDKDGPNLESSKSGIHWAAILGGAAAAAATTLVLIPLGTALGFGSFSVFNASTTSAVVFTAGWAIWFVVMQWVSSFLGGYIAGRLRVKWADLHSDEVFFRDTAHGFLAWAVATIVTLTIAGGLAGATVNAGAQAASNVAAGAVSNADLGYYSDSLYRGATASTADITPETARILARDAVNGDFSASDRDYLAHQVATRTGVAQPEADTRVNQVIAQIDATRQKALQAAEAARKTAVGVSITLFLSLLIGAFIACVSAALGGRLRDQY